MTQPRRDYDEYVDIADALAAAGVDWKPWADMLGPSVSVTGPNRTLLIWAPAHNVNGPTPPVWVVTFSGLDNDGSEYAAHPSEVPADLSRLFQIDVPDSPDAIKTILAIVRKELDE